MDWSVVGFDNRVRTYISNTRRKAKVALARSQTPIVQLSGTAHEYVSTPSKRGSTPSKRKNQDDNVIGSNVDEYITNAKVTIINDQDEPLAHCVIIDDQPEVTRDAAEAFDIGVADVGWYKLIKIQAIVKGAAGDTLPLELCADDDFNKFESKEDTKLASLHANYQHGFYIWHEFLQPRRLTTTGRRGSKSKRAKKN